MKPSEFIKYAKKKVEDSGIKFILTDKKYLLIDGEMVNGYFDEEKNRMACAIGKSYKKWLPIMVHEFSHFEQWESKCRAWQQGYINGDDNSDWIFKWVSGGKYSFERIKEINRRVRNLELDCERRTVKNIKKYKLPIDPFLYAQQANTYIYFHNYVLLRRRWWRKGYAPYDQKEVYSQFPTTLNNRYDRLPKKYIKLFDEYC